jgi:putative redox protein
MPTTTTKYLGSLRTESTHLRSGSVLLSDAPVDNNGKGEAFSPTDSTATSLTTCMLTVMGIHGQKMGYELSDSYAETTKTMSSDRPRRIVKIDIKMTVISDSPLSKDEQMKLTDIAANCPVALSLAPSIIQELSIDFQNPE